MQPIKRTGRAFLRTGVSLSIVIILIFTTVLSGIHTAFIRASLTAIGFGTRNYLAWHRALFTLGIMVIRVLHSLFRVLVLWASIAARYMALHYRGIRDLSIIFSPSAGSLVLFSLTGGILFLFFAIVYFAGILVSSYFYNRLKRGETDV